MKDVCKGYRDSRPLETLTKSDVTRNAEKINKFLKGLKVQYEIPGQPNSKRTYRVNELAESARNHKFKIDTGELFSVEKYFTQQKKYSLQYPELPCLWVGSRNNDRKIYLPIEVYAYHYPKLTINGSIFELCTIFLFLSQLCTIPAGQVTQRKMDENQTTALIRHAATNTATRKQKILDGVGIL